MSEMSRVKSQGSSTMSAISLLASPCLIGRVRCNGKAHLEALLAADLAGVVPAALSAVESSGLGAMEGWLHP